jgi:TolB protein
VKPSRLLAVGLALAVPGAALAVAVAGRDRPGSEGRIVFSTLEQHGGKLEGDIYVVDADGAGLARLTSRPGPEFDPVWSPDGTRIAYRDSRAGLNVHDQIYVMNADGSGARNVSRNSNCCDFSPAWSPDGWEIALNGLDLMAADGSNRRRLQLAALGEYPTWSPDGDRIAFSRTSGGGHDIQVVRRDGSDLRSLARSADYEMAPSWSPDGKWILYARGGPLGGRQIWVMRADGSDKRRLTRSRHDDFFSDWSPDGRRIVFTRDGVLHLMDADGLRQHSLGIEGDMPDWGP